MDSVLTLGGVCSDDGRKLYKSEDPAGYGIGPCYVTWGKISIPFQKYYNVSGTCRHRHSGQESQVVGIMV